MNIPEILAVAADLRHVLVEISMNRWPLEVRDWLPPIITRLERAAVPPMDKATKDRRFKCAVCGKPIDALMEWMKDGKMAHKECAVEPRDEREAAALRALGRIAFAAQHYAVNYCLDEADDVENCVCGEAQHRAAKELVDALAEWKP